MNAYLNDIDKLPYKVSGNNVYIYGYAVECDLLILKQDSKAIFEAPEIYRAEDVITIIESKATGIFIDKKKPKNPFLNELCMVKQLNDKGVGVKFAYISLAEQISGRSSRLLDGANRYINEYSNEKNKIRECIVFQKHIQKMNIHCMKEIHILLTSILNICAMIFHRHTET